MRVGMARMDLTRRLNAHRVLSLTVSFLALVGWGRSRIGRIIGSAERDLRAELAQSQAAQDQLRAERDRQQAAVGDLTQIQAKLVSARGELDTLAQKRDRATAQVAAVQQELMVPRSGVTRGRRKGLKEARVKRPSRRANLRGWRHRQSTRPDSETLRDGVGSAAPSFARQN